MPRVCPSVLRSYAIVGGEGGAITIDPGSKLAVAGLGDTYVFIHLEELSCCAADLLS
jgi:hypothetical protein